MFYKQKNLHQTCLSPICSTIQPERPCWNPGIMRGLSKWSPHEMTSLSGSSSNHTLTPVLSVLTARAFPQRIYLPQRFLFVCWEHCWFFEVLWTSSTCCIWLAILRRLWGKTVHKNLCCMFPLLTSRVQLVRTWFPLAFSSYGEGTESKCLTNTWRKKHRQNGICSSVEDSVCNIDV